METLKEAKAFLRENFKDGTKCPCCDQYVKLYKRKITSSMAYGAIVLARHFKVGSIVHIENFLKEQKGLPASIRGDISKLKYWNMIERLKGEKDDGNPSNGLYTIKKELLEFVYKNLKVKSHVLIYNNKMVGTSGEDITIKDAIGDKFNYSELMRGV